MGLKGKVAVVTGGAVRIGRAICEELADAGCDVIVHYRSSASDARELQSLLEGKGVRAFTLQAELQDPAVATGFVEECIAMAGHLDVLVNSAAVFNADNLESMTPESVLRELSINAITPMFLVQAFAAAVGEGDIINILDRRVAGVDVDRIPYWLSKRMLADFTRAAATSLAPGTRVNAVAPGAILPPPGESEEYLKEKAAPIPLATRDTPMDIAAAVRYLLEAKGVTGQTIFVDGGQHLIGME